MKLHAIAAFILPTVLCMNQEVADKIASDAREDFRICTEKFGAPEGKENCVATCIYKRIGFMNADGNIDVDGAMAYVESMKALEDEGYYNRVKELTELCTKINNSANECETGAAVCDCITANMVKTGHKFLGYD